MMNKEYFDDRLKKRLPYEVPANFFESITEETLRLAKRRQRKMHIKHIAVYTTVAASIVAILFFAGIKTNELKNTKLVTTNVQVEENIPRLLNKQSVPDSSSYHGLLLAEETGESAFEQNDEDADELFETLLATLTDEELQVLAGHISTELYLNELMEE